MIMKFTGASRGMLRRNGRTSLRAVLGHSRRFKREVGMTASPHERTYPAVIRSSEPRHKATWGAQKTARVKCAVA
jgi:hypothetical protein